MILGPCAVACLAFFVNTALVMAARSTRQGGTQHRLRKVLITNLVSSSLTIIVELTYGIMKHELCVTDPQNVRFCSTNTYSIHYEIGSCLLRVVYGNT